jgi:proteasome lid subunit RPN8/RPN11
VLYLADSKTNDLGIEIELKPPVQVVPYREAPLVIFNRYPQVALKPSVFISYLAWVKMLDHAYLNKDREIGGVLVGNLYRTRAYEYLNIAAVIEAINAIENKSSITFTHDTWTYTSNVIRDKYPGLKIVGWYHSHPGYGIFLSNDDQFIHKNFFSHQHQVALVIDPKKMKYGFYQWRGISLVKKDDIYIYSSVAESKEMINRVYKCVGRNRSVVTKAKANLLGICYRSNVEIALGIYKGHYNHILI